jgi:hypothetical protein
MRSKFCRRLVLQTLWLAAVFLPMVTWAAPPFRDVDERAELSPTRVVLQIATEDGVCLWRISGDDELVRMPLKDDRFGTVLLSAKFEGDQLSVSVAGEKEPLDTVPLGTYSFTLTGKDSPPIAVDALKKSRTAESWQLRALPPGAKSTIPGCCSCAMLKINCCPRAGKCLGCGSCGECCG